MLLDLQNLHLSFLIEQLLHTKFLQLLQTLR